MSVVDYRAWIGRSEERHDIVAAGPIRRLAALLDHETAPWAPGVLPPLGHWLYFLPEPRPSALQPDGRTERGGLLPPVALPRRMWAGGRIDFLAPIAFGAAMIRRSTVAEVAPKDGRSGQMVFMTLRHEIFVGVSLALREEQDLVFRGHPAAEPPAPAAAPTEAADFRRSVQPGPVELFQYSALTYNGHRIHYDRDYTIREEGYPGLLVHGPLIATLIVDNALRWRPTWPIRRFAYRARSPLFMGTAFDLCAAATPSGVRVWAQTPGYSVAMEGELTL